MVHVYLKQSEKGLKKFQLPDLHQQMRKLDTSQLQIDRLGKVHY